MLKSLQIKDYALIENIQVEFGKNLNIITGETGAGKSILIDAMSLLLGERASTEVVRKGTSKSVVEGIFEITGNKKVENLLLENEIDLESELIVRREVSLKGSNRCFINDTPVNLTVIKDLGNLLVDLHGQHEHQSLLRTETHITMLDEVADSESLIAKYSIHYKKLLKSISELNEIKAREEIIKEKKEIYAFQIKEIDSVSPVDGEEENLMQELNIHENSERLLELSNSVYNQLYESENALYDSLVKIKNDLEELTTIDKSFEESLNESNLCLTYIDDITSFVRSYMGKIEAEPERLEDIRERLGSISLLKKKYGGSIKSILAIREKIGKEFELADNFAHAISNLESEIEVIRKESGTIAQQISSIRKKASQKITKEVKEVLNQLGIPDAEFDILIKQQIDSNSQFYITADKKRYKSYNNGFDEVEFFISTNAGEDPKPLVKVASGGEVSRIMLALKSILAKSDKLPLLIFDEIDTGVSGRIAQKVGTTLSSLAAFHQIIAITHLPQIAGLANHHYTVEKSAAEGRVISSIRKLNDNERIEEVAKLMSGEKITEASLNGAKELINSSRPL